MGILHDIMDDDAAFLAGEADDFGETAVWIPGDGTDEIPVSFVRVSYGEGALLRSDIEIPELVILVPRTEVPNPDRGHDYVRVALQRGEEPTERPVGDITDDGGGFWRVVLN